MSEISSNKVLAKRRVIVISAVIYILILLFIVAMYLQTKSSIQSYNSILAGYSQPLPRAISAEKTETEAKSVQLASLIKEMDAVLARSPSSLDTEYELLEMARRHNLEIVSLTSRGEKKQTISKGNYKIHSYGIIVVGAKQEIINMVGDLQNFSLGLLSVDGVNFIVKGEVHQADISFSVYSREPFSERSTVESAK